MSWVRAHPAFLLLFGYLLLAGVFGFELLTPGRSLYRWDTLLYNWPVLLETRSQFLSGHMPFWASSFCCGTPLLENINAGVLYPMRLVCWVLPLKPGYHVFVFLHLWLSLVGMHVLLRRGMRLSTLAAFIGAVAYAASGYARSTWDTHNFMALPWIPLGLAALLEARHQGRRLWAVIGTTLCWSMMILGGDFQAACAWLPCALLLALLMPQRKMLAGVLGCAALLAVLITAPQWLPTLSATLDSYRATGLDLSEAMERSFHPVRALELFLPHAFGTHEQWLGTSLAGEGAKKLLPWTASFHVGLLALLPACLALRKRRQPFVRWATLVLLISLFLSFGRHLPGFQWWLRLPLVGAFRYPEKYLLWSTLGLAVLAAQGAGALRAAWASKRAAGSLGWMVISWTVVLTAGAALASIVVLQVSTSTGIAMTWLVGRWIAAATIILLVLVVCSARRVFQTGIILPALIVVDLFFPWHVERPTSSQFQPLKTATVAEAIRSSNTPWERCASDYSLRNTPVPPEFSTLSPSERSSVLYREALAFNSPRLWGLRSADGFSPLESRAMQELRLRGIGDRTGEIATAEAFARFCRQTGVRWILTTSSRAREINAQGLEAPTAKWWGPNKEVMLLRVRNVTDGECRNRHPSTEGVELPQPVIRRVRRARPGEIRVDLIPGAATDLLIKETYARGWTAADARGEPLATKPMDEAFLGVSVPAEVTQVRLRYTPIGWWPGVFLGAAGLALVCIIAAACPTTKPFASLRLRATLPAVVSCGLFLVVGTAARNHWSCTFDEGYHVTRGLVRVRTGDSRLSYSHPPLQNALCGYFADLAHGDRLRFGREAGWDDATITTYSPNFAYANRSVFPDAVRASRWGTALFGLLLCVVVTCWAGQAAGLLGAWVAALGIALNPTILAHGNLSTTDMGVTALAIAATYALWRYVRDSRISWLCWATIGFAAAAVTKHTGLIWFSTYVLLALPLLAVAKRSFKPVAFMPLGLLLFALFLVGLYGLEPQTVRTPAESWLSGKSWVAGRYVEGLVRQGHHALEGHRAYFAHRWFTQAPRWCFPLALILKTPIPWACAFGLALCWFLWRRPRFAYWACVLPALIFSVLLFSANRIAIGVRHGLPLYALGILAAAVWASSLRRRFLRGIASLVLFISAIATVAFTHPDYISYFPLPAGGIEHGHYWSVDSNYDWGQNLDALEGKWAALTEANDGQPLHLLYFGFLDPRAMYDMTVAEPSLCGYMGHRRRELGDPRTYEAWRKDVANITGSAVASISALTLNPYGLELSTLQNGEFVGRVADTFVVYYKAPADPELQARIAPDDDL